MKGASLIAPLGVRIPDELKEKIQAQAKENGRSMNAEILYMLENSLSESPDQEVGKLHEQVMHLSSMLEMKEQIIALQKRTIQHMDKTIASLEETINILKDRIESYNKSYNQHL
ncbi:TPA: Arc family DNA-binding protein [Raoultella ornithinolytica]